MSFKDNVDDFYSYYRLQQISINNVSHTFAHFGKVEEALVMFSGGLEVKEVWCSYYKDLVSDHQILLFSYPKSCKTRLDLVKAVHDLVSFLGLKNIKLVAARDGVLDAMLYSRTYKKEVGGLVLIDPVNLDSNYKLEEEYEALNDRLNKIINSDEENVVLEDIITTLKNDYISEEDYLAFKDKISFYKNFAGFKKDDFKGLKTLVIKDSTTNNNLINLFDIKEVKTLANNPYTYLVRTEEYINVIREFLGELENEL